MRPGRSDRAWRTGVLRNMVYCARLARTYDRQAETADEAVRDMASKQASRYWRLAWELAQVRFG